MANEQLNELLNSLLRGIGGIVSTQRQQSLGVVRVTEVDSVSVGCQTDDGGSESNAAVASTVQTVEASTQTNPFEDYERPLSFDAATQWEDPSRSSIITPTVSSSVSWMSTPDESSRDQTCSDVEMANRFHRRSLPSLPLGGSSMARNVLCSFPNTEARSDFPWERNNTAAEPTLRQMPRSSSSMSPVRQRPRSSCPRSPVKEPPKKRGRPRKSTTGVKCRLCEKPIADRMLAPCGHFFCQHCIYNWTQTWTHCPHCAATPVRVTEPDFN